MRASKKWDRRVIDPIFFIEVIKIEIPFFAQYDC